MSISTEVFDSFFIGGFECADHINRDGDRINLLKETDHDSRTWEDYRLLREVGIKTAREGLCWSKVETAPFVYDFSEVENRYRAAAHHGIQQIWDLCHFGYPDGIYPTHPHFCARFVALCKAFAAFHKTSSRQQLFVVPVNEISFLAWHSGDVRGTVPFAINCGFDIKYHLCKAVINGIACLREELPDCRIIIVEPLIKVHGCVQDDPAELMALNEAQFQAMDMIAGRMCPELGGTETNLDILGFNYYWDCQWEHHGLPLQWPESTADVVLRIGAVRHENMQYTGGACATVEMNREPPPQTGNRLRRTTLASLLAHVYTRYERPIFLAETGHFGSGRARWLDEITLECMTAINDGVELLGICLYPVVDRPDWDDLSHYHNSGIWDLDEAKNRVPYVEYVEMLHSCIGRIANIGMTDVSFENTAA